MKEREATLKCCGCGREILRFRSWSARGDFTILSVEWKSAGLKASNDPLGQRGYLVFGIGFLRFGVSWWT